MSDKPKYWFPAKCYGWGWGPPSTWQGWIVLAGYLLLMIPGINIIDPKVNMINFLLYTTAHTLLRQIGYSGYNEHETAGELFVMLLHMYKNVTTYILKHV